MYAHMSPPILLHSSSPYVHLHSGLDYQVCALLFIICRSLARSLVLRFNFTQPPKPSPRARSHHRPRGARPHAQAHVRHDLEGHVHHPQDAHVPPDGPAVQPDEPGEGVRLLLREDLELLAQERVVGVVDLCVGLYVKCVCVCGATGNELGLVAETRNCVLYWPHQRYRLDPGEPPGDGGALVEDAAEHDHRGGEGRHCAWGGWVEC